MNREGVRRLAAEELELPAPTYAFADSLAGLQAAIDREAGKTIGYPCLVKPTVSSSGKGQPLLRGPTRRGAGMGVRDAGRSHQPDAGHRRVLHSAAIYGGIAFEGVARALSVQQSDLRLFGKPESFKKWRMGVALAGGTDTDQARRRAKLAAGLAKPVVA